MEGTGILTELFISFSFLIFLYAETHYKFKYFFSYLRKPEPEIIADAPFRINPDERFPILLLVKDAHLYPCTIHSVKAILRFLESELPPIEYNLLTANSLINEKWWWKIFWLDAPKNFYGLIEVDIIITVSVNGKQKTILNDNYRTSSHKPLQIYIAETPLPTLKSLYLGEMHSHSSYTEDQVEFGAPVEPTTILGKAIGLSFAAITDHSYDLDDDPDNYLKNHPEQPKWRSFLQDAKNFSNNEFTILYGEEVSCRNSLDKNVHMLVLNNENFIPGSGDGAEKWFYTRSENSIVDIVSNAQPDTLIIAAHPCDNVSFVQSLLLNRGQWTLNDFLSENIHGIQFINGTLTNGFSKGYNLWVKLLLQGARLALFAGNDAHGNFNRYRQLKIPFFLLHESSMQIFGKMRTGIFASTNSRTELINASKAGRTIVTDGPVVNISFANESDTIIGSIIARKNTEFSIVARSTKEFGSLDNMLIYAGKIGSNKEEIIYSTHNIGGYDYRLQKYLTIDPYDYIRLELYTNKNGYDKEHHFCLTTPVWIQRT